MHDGQNSDKATGQCHGHVDLLAEYDKLHRKWYLKAFGCGCMNKMVIKLFLRACGS